MHVLIQANYILPRPHGGVSREEIAREVSASSSPSPRGCFLYRFGSRIDRMFFPVPTGVFPRRFGTKNHCVFLPRPHGGVSTVLELFDLITTSSPSPRGCFHEFCTGAVFETFFPVPTGVFPGWIFRSSPAIILPRPHGGVSVLRSTASVTQSSSPSPRGCFYAYGRKQQPSAFFPVPTGVFLQDFHRRRWRRFLPRPHGGVSMVIELFDHITTSSPSPRGCFQPAYSTGQKE